jgi:hypothetical protein
VSTVAAPVEWNVEDSDRDGSHDQTNATTRQRFKAVADGWYRTTATIRYSATTGTYRHVNLRKYNTSDAGETDCGTDRRPSGQAFQSYAWPAVFLRQGEYLRVWVEADAAIDVMLDGVASPVVTFEKVG